MIKLWINKLKNKGIYDNPLNKHTRVLFKNTHKQNKNDALDPTFDMHCQCEKETQEYDLRRHDLLKGGEIGQCDRGQVTHTQCSDTPQIILPHASAKKKKKLPHSQMSKPWF